MRYQFIKINLLTIGGIVLGAIAGFVYWKLVVCDSGSCVISSNPTNSTLYGSALGGLVFSTFKKKEK